MFPSCHRLVMPVRNPNIDGRGRIPDLLPLPGVLPISANLSR
jgi:hypothetical protein